MKRFAVGLVFVIAAGVALESGGYLTAVLRATETPSAPTPTDTPASVEDTPGGVKPHAKLGGDFKIVRFKNGWNKIDLNADGILDAVLMLRRENGTSPHWYSTYTFAVYSKSLTYDSAPYWHAVSIWKLKESWDDDIYVDSLSSVEADAGIIADVRLMVFSDVRPVLVIADRERGESYVISGLVSFHFYDLAENPDGDWSSQYSYDYRDTAVSDAKYVSVEEAIDKELKNKY